MGLKSPQLSLLFDSGMEHGELFRDSLAMVLKTDRPVQPNGSPLLSPPMKNADVFVSSNGCNSRPQPAPPPQMQPLRVDVNGYRQYSLLSPLDGQSSSLVSSALPTPLLDLESNSNCSDSAVPQGDLYPAVFAAANVSFRSQADVRSPPGTLPPGAFAFSTQNYKVSPAKAPMTPMLVKRPVELNKKALTDKVTRHKGDLKFMIPRSAEANPAQLTAMLKRVRKLADLPKAIDASLFEDEVVEPVAKTAKSSDRPVDQDLTDYSDLEDEPEEGISVFYKKIRDGEERARFSCEDARISFNIQERKRFRDQLVRKLESAIAHEEQVLDTSPTHCCARARPYIRQSNRKLLRFNDCVDYSKMQPSTSGSSSGISDDSCKAALANAVHWASMVPPFTTRRSLGHPVHTIDGQDLQEECVRNGWNRRAEKEKRRLRAEAGKDRDSSDYEDTDQSDSEYYPKNVPLPKKVEKKKGRGRPPRDKTDNSSKLAKAGRRHSQFANNYEYFDGLIELTYNSLLTDIPQYQEIIVPDRVVPNKVEACQPGECQHKFDDLEAELKHFHHVAEQEEKARFKTKEGRRAAAPKRETSMDESCWADSPGSKASPSLRPAA